MQAKRPVKIFVKKRSAKTITSSTLEKRCFESGWSESMWRQRLRIQLEPLQCNRSRRLRLYIVQAQ